MKTLAKKGALFCVFLLALTIPVIAQISYGTLRGTVSDPAGRVVPGAEVILTDTATAAQYKSIANGSGAYAILDVPLGRYTLTAQKEGFQTATQGDLTMTAGDNKTIDIALKVGSASEKVEVSSAAPGLETTTGAFSQTEDADSLLQLPLNTANYGRQLGFYVAVLPGFQTGAIEPNVMDGALGSYSEYSVNGSSVLADAAIHGDTYFSMSPEAVAEMKVTTTPMADTGNSGGVAMSFQARSGTNAYHGAAYIYQHTTDLDAAAEFSNRASRDQQGEYGFELGGPLSIPKIYDGRNKTFFWANYGWYHSTDSTSGGFRGVPTDAWKAGNFADQLGAQIGTDDLGRPVLAGQIYNPYSTTTAPDGTVVRNPFPGNIIPPALFSSVATKFQSFEPEPTLPGDPPNNFHVNAGQAAPGGSATGSAPRRVWQINLDQNISNRDHLGIAYWNTRALTFSPETMPVIYTRIFGQVLHGNAVHAGWTHTFSPTLVHVLAAGMDRQLTNDYGLPFSYDGGITMGTPNLLGGPSCTPGFGVPNISASGDSALCNVQEGDTNFGINDNWTKSFGHHVTKWGFNLYRYNDNFPFTWNLGAGFLAGESAIPNQPNCANCLNTTGVAYASFLMGAVHDANAQGGQYPEPRSLGYGFYVGDEFRVTPKLTLTYGLRYDAAPMPIESGGRTTQFNFTLPNAAAGGIPGALTFGGHGPGTLNTDQMAPSEYLTTNFAPKFSFAYQFMPKWVVRGAYSMNYGPPDQTGDGFITVFQQGYFPNFNVVTTDGYTPAYSLDNGFPVPQGVPVYNNLNPTLYNGSSTGYFGPTADHAPRIQDLHFDVEHELPGRIVVSMNYTGSFAHGVITSFATPQNQLNYEKYGNLGNLLSDDIYSANARAANIPIPYAGFVGSVAQALLPFPQFGDIENQSATVTFSDYNAGLLQATRSFSNGLSFLFGYTFMKQISNMDGSQPGASVGEPQDAYNLGAEKAIGVVDVPQQVLFNYTYELPFGHGKQFNIDNRGLDAIAGGWSLAGIHTYQSANPLSITTNQTLPTVIPSLRPNVVPGQPVRTNKTCGNINPFNGDLFLNPAAFADPAPFTFGNARPQLDNAFGCPYLNESVSFFKAFSITEGIKVKIGADFFNLFNRHEWAAPNTDIDSGAYGVITGQANSPRSIQANARISF